MNQKYNELVNEAYELVDAAVSEDDWDTYIHYQMAMEKVFELSVAECKSVLRHMIKEGHGDLSTLVQCLTEIDRRFGVE